jgi:competence protein ComEA
LSVDEAKPHDTGRMRAKLRLLGGARSYELTVRLLSGDRELDSRSVSVTPVPKPGVGARVEDWVTSNALPLVGALGALLLLGAVLGVRYVSRLKSAVEPAASPPPPPPAAPPEPAPEPRIEPAPAPPAAGLIDLNRADVEELVKLRGVGRAAARRIVEHREEYGDFGSLDDLARVEGFTPERIHGLAPQAMV